MEAHGSRKLGPATSATLCTNIKSVKRAAMGMWYGSSQEGPGRPGRHGEDAGKRDRRVIGIYNWSSACRDPCEKVFSAQKRLMLPPEKNPCKRAELNGSSRDVPGVGRRGKGIVGMPRRVG